MYTKSIPPSNELIRSKINADLTLKVAVSELIANSLGQGARNIALELNTKKQLYDFIITDDGEGCDDLEQMMQLGHHIINKRKSLGDIGINGVGFKDAVIWLGGSVRVDSCTTSGKKQMALADWENMMAVAQKGQWPIDFHDDSAQTKHGVTITVEAVRRKRVSYWKLVPGYITERFSAAIDAGVVITVDGKPVPAAADPILEDKTPFKIMRDGRICEGYFGILVRRHNQPSGWNIRKGWHTVLSNYTSEGFADYSPEGFWGMLYMIDGEKKWNLSTHKNNSEDIPDMLNCLEMQEKIKPVLEKLKSKNASMIVQASHSVALTTMTELLQKIKVSQAAEGKEATPGERKEPGEIPGGKKPNVFKPRAPRSKWNVDPLSRTKRIIQCANEIKFFEIKDGSRFGYAELTQGGKLLKIHIDCTSDIGQKTWKNSGLLVQTSIMLLATYFGTDTDIQLQLSFPVEDAPTVQERVSKICMYLFQHLDFNITGNSIKAA